MTTTQFRLRFFALLGIAMGIVVLFLSIRGPTAFPERRTLESLTGSVISASPERYSIRFSLSGDSRTFSYAYKSGDRAAVASVLTDGSRQPITILVNPGNPQQGLSGGPFFQVYELASRQALLRSYSQVKSSWKSDYRLGYFVAIFAFLAAGYLEYAARRCAA